MECNWCEALSRGADLAGFAGALLLAYPFLTGQSSRDTAALLKDMVVADNEDKKIVEITRHGITEDISIKSLRELRLAWIGAGLIGLAFISKFVASLF